NFRAVAIDAVIIRGRVRAITVDAEFHQRRTVAGTGILDGLMHDVIHGHRVHTVNLIAGHAVGVGLVGNMPRPRLLVTPDTNGIAIVLAGKYHRRILYGSEVHGGVPIAFAGGAVAECHHHDFVLALLLRGHGHADGRRHLRGHAGARGENMVPIGADVGGHLPTLVAVTAPPQEL